MTNNYLMSIQGEFLADRTSDKLYKELFQAVYDMAIFQIHNILKQNHTWLDENRITDLAADVSIRIMGRYEARRWYVKSNYLALIQRECVHQMFDKRFIDRIDYSGDKKAIMRLSSDSENTEMKDAESLCEDLKRIMVDEREYMILVALAEVKKAYSKFLLGVAKYHSFDWMKEHINNLHALWDRRYNYDARNKYP